MNSLNSRAVYSGPVAQFRSPVAQFRRPSASGFGATATAQDMETAFNDNQIALSESRKALIVLGLERRRAGETLTVDEVEAFSTVRRKSAMNVTAAIAYVNDQLKALDESTSWVPFGGGYLEKYGIKEDLGLKLLDAIPLLPRDLLPAEYQSYPGYPSLTPEEANFGFVPAGWAVGTALVLAAASAFIYFSRDTWAAIFTPKAVEMTAQASLIAASADAQIRLVQELVKSGVDAKTAAGLAKEQSPKIEDPDGGSWALALLKWGLVGVALIGGGYWFSQTKTGKQLLSTAKGHASAAGRHLRVVEG